MPEDDTTQIKVKLTEDEREQIKERTGKQIDELVIPTTTELGPDNEQPQSIRV